MDGQLGVCIKRNGILFGGGVYLHSVGSPGNIAVRSGCMIVNDNGYPELFNRVNFGELRPGFVERPGKINPGIAVGLGIYHGEAVGKDLQPFQGGGILPCIVILG